MKKTVILASALLALSAPAGVAGPIDSACMSAGRAASNRALCTCIQRVADMTLSRSDQRQAARFFRDPHRAQEVRQSDRARDSAFWQRYRGFVSSAEQLCAR